MRAAAVALLLGACSGEANPDVDRIAERVSRIRGLPIERPIEHGVGTAAQYRATARETVLREYGPAWLRGDELVMKRLGLLPPDADYLETFLGYYSVFAGYYDPESDRLYVAEGVPAEGTLAHEICHALQDQHHDLDRWSDVVRENGDASNARSAVIEGDAMATMFEYEDRSAWLIPSWRDPAMIDYTLGEIRASILLGEAPLAIESSTAFMYADGYAFVAAAGSSWAAVDALYARPPLSTEHILHIEKYRSYEPPVEIVPSSGELLPGFELFYRNVAGELGFSILLRQHGVDPTMAAHAAAGWGGDCVVVLRHPRLDTVEASVVISYSVWDTEADAVELHAALSTTLPALAGASVDRRGDAVLLIVGAPPARANELRDQIWKAWTVRR
jgi:hypothetical protein